MSEINRVLRRPHRVKNRESARKACAVVGEFVAARIQAVKRRQLRPRERDHFVRRKYGCLRFGGWYFRFQKSGWRRRLCRRGNFTVGRKQRVGGRVFHQFENEWHSRRLRREQPSASQIKKSEKPAF